jgi:hypothetical protein
MRYKYLDNWRLAKVQSEFESACFFSRLYNSEFADFCAIYGDKGPDVSGAGKAHFPDEVKARLRTLAQAVAMHCDKARDMRPKGIHSATIRRLGQEVATRDGVGFYGPSKLIERH